MTQEKDPGGLGALSIYVKGRISPFLFQRLAILLAGNLNLLLAIGFLKEGGRFAGGDWRRPQCRPHHSRWPRLPTSS
jgi:hypothetical protein